MSLKEIAGVLCMLFGLGMAYAHRNSYEDTTGLFGLVLAIVGFVVYVGVQREWIVARLAKHMSSAEDKETE